MSQKVIIQAYCNNCAAKTQSVEIPLDVLLCCRSVGGPSKLWYRNDGANIVQVYEPDAGIDLPFSVAECECGRNPCQTIQVAIEGVGL
jgi:hypothetical protein